MGCIKNCKVISIVVVSCIVFLETTIAVSGSNDSFSNIDVNAYVVDLKQGSIVGTPANKKTNVLAFMGIPYAEPPVGSRRWKPPFPAVGWGGVLSATSFAPSCMQPEIIDTRSMFYHHTFSTSEDCLYLNVWTEADSVVNSSQRSLVNTEKKVSERTKRPVMVWIHGGGLIWGTASHAITEGDILASEGVVVVSINYRLGVFGNFSHPELTEESPHKSSGNLGTLDQILALKWVRENIEAFGGDPNNITIWGESAGALSVSHLMASPRSRGLFHKAIMQSAYLPPIPKLKETAYGRPSAESLGMRLQRSAKASGIDELRAMSADAIMHAADGLEFDKIVLDGWVFSEQIFETFERGGQRDIPLLAGFNRDEGKHFVLSGYLSVPPTSEDYRVEIKKRYGGLADQYFKIYPDSDLHRSTYLGMGEALNSWGTEKIVRLMDLVESDVYLYNFDYVTQEAKQRGMGAPHASEIAYVFHKLESVRDDFPNFPNSNSPAIKDILTGDLMSTYWTNFAKTGNPNSAGLVHWPRYTNSHENFLQFSEGTAIAKSNPRPGMFELHEKIVNDRRKNRNFWSYRNIGLRAPVSSNIDLND